MHEYSAIDIIGEQGLGVDDRDSRLIERQVRCRTEIRTFKEGILQPRSLQIRIP